MSTDITEELKPGALPDNGAGNTASVLDRIRGIDIENSEVAWDIKEEINTAISIATALSEIKSQWDRGEKDAAMAAYLEVNKTANAQIKRLRKQQPQPDSLGQNLDTQVNLGQDSESESDDTPNHLDSDQVSELAMSGREIVRNIFIHDLGNSYNAMNLSASITTSHGKRGFETLVVEDIDGFHNSIVELCQRASAQVEDPFRAEEVGVGTIEVQMRRHLSGSATEFIVIGDSKVSDMKVNWSSTWIAGLTENIAGNIKKAWEDKDAQYEDKQVKLDVNEVEIDGQRCVRVTITNKGSQFPEALVTSGFAHDIGGWQKQETASNRVGMASYAAVMKGKYGIDIRPVNVPWEEGSEELAAQVQILIPAA